MKMTKLKTVDIKWKSYVEVNQRIKYFRETYKDWRITTSIVSDSEWKCVFRAEIYDWDNLLATGHAYEKEWSTFINKTSYLENCETSAIGRALWVLWIGIDESVASFEEVANAVTQQKKPTKQTMTKEDYDTFKKKLDAWELDKWNIETLIKAKKETHDLSVYEADMRKAFEERKAKILEEWLTK